VKIPILAGSIEGATLKLDEFISDNGISSALLNTGNPCCRVVLLSEDVRINKYIKL
jgi:hypothetical protein